MLDTTPRHHQPHDPASRIGFDEDGFLVDPDAWSQQTARMIAARHGIQTLLPVHWSVIAFIQDYHQRFGAVPLMRQVCRAHNLNRDTVKDLFGNCLTAWRIAGLPNPGEEAKAYMA